MRNKSKLHLSSKCMYIFLYFHTFSTYYNILSKNQRSSSNLTVMVNSLVNVLYHMMVNKVKSRLQVIILMFNVVDQSAVVFNPSLLPWKLKHCVTQNCMIFFFSTTGNYILKDRESFFMNESNPEFSALINSKPHLMTVLNWEHFYNVYDCSTVLGAKKCTL